MALINLAIGVTIKQYTYIDEQGREMHIDTPMTSKAVIPANNNIDLLKNYSQQIIGLNELFLVSYTIITHQEEGEFVSLLIQDPLLNEANGFTYGTPTVTSTYQTEPFTRGISLDYRGGFSLDNESTLILPGEQIVVCVPVQIKAISAQDYLNNDIRYTINYTNIAHGEGKTLNTIQLQSVNFFIQLTSSWKEGYVYSGDLISYYFVLCNEGTMPIEINKGELIQPLPREVYFVGWGEDGKAEVPEGFDYIEQLGIVNNQLLVVNPLEYKQNTVAFLIQIK